MSGSYAITAQGNTITSSVGDGINILTTSALNSVNVTLTSNTVTNAGGNGVVLADSNSVVSGITATINGNTITGSTLDGINLQFHNLGSGVQQRVSGSRQQ